MPSSWLLAARLQDGREGSAVLLYVVAKGHKHFLHLLWVPSLWLPFLTLHEDFSLSSSVTVCCLSPVPHLEAGGSAL